MALTRDDRRMLSSYGLVLLVYGLAFAPLLHAVFQHGGASWDLQSSWVTHERQSPWAPHDESKPHSHGFPGDPSSGAVPHTHGIGSLEHLGAVMARSEVVVAPVLWLVALAVAPSVIARSAQRRRDLTPSMPQGP